MPNILEVKAVVEFQPVNRPVKSTGDLRVSYEADNKRYINGIQEVGAVEEALQLGDVATAGYVVLINRSTTINVQVGLTGSYPITLLPGQFCIFPPGAGALFAIAASDTADVEYHIFPVKATES